MADINSITENLKKSKKVGITLDELSSMICCFDYVKMCGIITELLDSSVIEPIKRSGLNGRNPPLYVKYRIIKKFELSEEIKNEINTLHYYIDTTYLTTHYEHYLANRKLLLKLSDYLKTNSSALLASISENERAYEIWGNEKVLDNSENVSLLKKCISLERLNMYASPEPFFEYRINTPAKTILACENKDTWFTLRKLITDEGYSNVVLGVAFDSLIYSEGNKVTKSTNSLTDYLSVSCDFNGRVFYWGDIDYEGLGIFIRAMAANPELDIIPFAEVYKTMVDLFYKKLEAGADKEVFKGHQNQKRPENINVFYDMLDGGLSSEIDKLLISGFYIPQEIINGSVLRKIMVRKIEP